MNKLIARMFDKTRDCRLVRINTGALRQQQLVFGYQPRRNTRIAVTRDHRERAAREIAPATREIAVSSIDQPFVTETSVLSEHHLTQTEVANSVGGKVFIQNVELDGVADRFRHLPSIWIEPHAVGHDRARQLYVRRNQKRGPVDRVKTEDVLPDQMQRGPELLKSDGFLALLVSKANRGDVIRECVEPHIHRVCGIVRHRHAPAYRSLQTTYGQVLEPATHKADYFVAPVLGPDKIRPALKH